MLRNYLFDYIFIEGEEGGLFLAVRDHLLRKVEVIRIKERCASHDLRNDLSLDNSFLGVQPAQPAGHDLVDFLVEHPLSHVNGVHGADVVRIWKGVLLVGVLGDVHGLDILLLVGHELGDLLLLLGELGGFLQEVRQVIDVVGHVQRRHSLSDDLVDLLVGVLLVWVVVDLLQLLLLGNATAKITAHKLFLYYSIYQ